MKITPPADDYGLQMLKQADSHREIKETGKLEPYPRIASSEERHEPKQPMVSERRQERRRHRERRLVRFNTLLNTRDSHERRAKARREPGETASGSRGFDSFA